MVLLALPVGAAAIAQAENPKSTNDVLTSEQIGRLLKEMGFEPEALAPDVWQAPIVREGWKVNVMVSLSPNRDRCWLESKFAVIAEPELVSASAWRNLLAENERIGPCFFAFDKSDKRLHLYKTFDNIGVTPARLKKELDAFDAVVRKTQQVWRSENYAPVESLPVAPRLVEQLPKASFLDGAWRIVRVETKGDSTTEEKLIASRPCVIFANDKATLKTGPGPERTVRVKLDPTQRPRSIDFIDENGAVEAGIYILETGLLTVCFASAGEERPRQFITNPKNRHWLLVLKKVE
jgi:uncharacterized protein (TIGR03067 family)